jgi:CBS domain-containing protein
VALGHDPSLVRCADLCEGTPRWVDAEADVGEVLHEMESRRIRRMPVVANKRLVGMISEADLAAHLSERQLGEFVERICGV